MIQTFGSLCCDQRGSAEQRRSNARGEQEGRDRACVITYSRKMYGAMTHRRILSLTDMGSSEVRQCV